AALERRNQLCFRINRAERPNVAELRVVINSQVPLLFPDEAPHLVELEVATLQVAHLRIHQGSATLTDSHTESHNRVPVDSGYALNRADAGTFGQCADYRNLLVFR